jgi:asparagine synthase (glutamine-hydrolysing)
MSNATRSIPRDALAAASLAREARGLCALVAPGADPGSSAAILRRMAAAAPRRFAPGAVQLGAIPLIYAVPSTLDSPARVQPIAEPSVAAWARIDNAGELVPGASASLDAARLIRQAYLQYGRALPKRLLGDFAFVLWDPGKGGALAATDWSGLRPLYYRCEEGRLLVASEASQVMAGASCPRRIDEVAVAAHLAAKDIPAGRTFYEGIQELPAGHALWWNGERAEVWRFEDFLDVEPAGSGSEADFAEQLRELFLEAVRCRLRGAERPGILLSGGLDSCAVASSVGWLQAQRQLPAAGLQSYSWAFPTLPQCDERSVSDVINHHYDFSGHCVEAEQYAPLTGECEGETHADAPAIYVYTRLVGEALRRAAGDGVDLLLTGFRGDVVTGPNKKDALDLLLRGHVAALWRDLRSYAQGSPYPLRRLVRWYLLEPGRAELLSSAAARPIAPTLRRLFRRPNGPAAVPWLTPAMASLAQDLAPRTPARTAAMTGPARGERYAAVTMPFYARAAAEQERQNARFGIGYVDPWSDRRLAQFALAAPQAVLNRVGQPKRLVRLAMRDIMPDAARRSARKTVPTAFFEQTIRQTAQGPIRQLLDDSRSGDAGYINPTPLREAYAGILAGGWIPAPFWPVLTLERWLRCHW